jgi:hypothetical protein
VLRSTLTKYGRVTEGQSDDGLLACDVSITMADHRVAGLTIRLDATPTPAAERIRHFLLTVPKPHGLSLVRPRYENTQSVADCVHELDFADSSAIAVEAGAPSNLANDDFCKIGGAALDAVLVTVTSGRLVHRSFPSNTVAARPDICEMVAPDTLALVPTLRSAHLEESPGGVQCIWRNGLTELVWTLYAEPGTLERPIAPYQKRVDIAGRPSLVSNLPGTRCDVITVGNSLGVVDLHGKPTREDPVVSIYAGLDDTTRCQVARKVAARIWSQLPS